MSATEMLAEIAAVLDRAGVEPSTLRIEWPPNDGKPRVTMFFRYPADMRSVCEATGTKMPEGDGDRDRPHYSTVTKAGWVLSSMAFPHHTEVQR